MTDSARIRKLRHALEQAHKALKSVRFTFEVTDALSGELTHIEANIVASLEATQEEK